MEVSMSNGKRAHRRPLHISRRLYAAVKLDSRPAYRIAEAAGLHASTLSKLIRGTAPLRPQDPRVLAVARVVGVTPQRAFTTSRALVAQLPATQLCGDLL